MLAWLSRRVAQHGLADNLIYIKTGYINIYVRVSVAILAQYMLQIDRQPLVLLAMRRSALPFPFPLDARSCSNLIGARFDANPHLKGRGKGGRRNLQPCTVCGERFVEGIQMWSAGWLRNDEGRDLYDHYVCWRCWDKFDDEVKEHIFLDITWTLPGYAINRSAASAVKNSPVFSCNH